jgi:hypothetical protein
VLIENNFAEIENACDAVARPDLDAVEAPAVSRYESPSASSVFPLEYAFYLLGSVHGQTVVVAGEVERFSVSVLSQLGARMICADIEDGKIILSPGDSTVDHVFCGPMLRDVDPVVTARQIRRILRPGGTAVFNERVDNEAVMRLKIAIQSEYNPPLELSRMLTLEQVHRVSRAVGMPGRSREFGLTTPLLAHMGFGPDSSVAKISQRADAALLRRWSFVRRFASQLVWEARKEC